MKVIRPADGVGRVAGAALLLLCLGTAGTASANTLTTLYSFGGYPDATNPIAGVISDASGNLYGTTPGGGANNAGAVYRVTPSGAETVLYSFKGSLGGGDGQAPDAGLVADSADNLYGVTYQGGAGGCSYPGCGTVFKLTKNPDGSYTESVLYSFTGGSDGGGPHGTLLADPAFTYLYGTTAAGGSGNGTVFKIPASGGSPTVLHSFTGSDGSDPMAGLVADATFSNLYGTTYRGGGGGCLGYGCGTVFQVTPAGAFNVLHIFAGGTTDGGSPFAALTLDASGNLYGTTTAGGGTGCTNGQGCGTVFELTPNGTTETILYSFTGGSDGGVPSGGLMVDNAGNLYGTTEAGGDAAAPAGDGTVFKLNAGTTAPWSETVLYTFAGSDGSSPYSDLIADASGNLYGTTDGGGSGGYGTVFKLSLSATFAGVPGQPNCHGQSISFLARKYGGIAHAASSLGYASVDDLQNAVTAFCGN